MENSLQELLKDSRYCISFSLQDEYDLEEKTGASLIEIECAALSSGIVPERYTRNFSSISLDEQIKLLKARVAVIGCGGLGGYVIQELARLGVGDICACDYDCYEEHNLNRQCGSKISFIGHSKVEAMGRMVKQINPAVNFRGYFHSFSANSSMEMLRGIQLVIDALDNVPDRMSLADLCSKFNVPLIHGAVDGWYGQIAVQFPGDDILEQLYNNQARSTHKKSRRSVLTFTPPVIASIQVAEAAKVLLDRGGHLRSKVMFIDLLEMDVEIIDMNNE